VISSNALSPGSPKIWHTVAFISKHDILHGHWTKPRIVDRDVVISGLDGEDDVLVALAGDGCHAISFHLFIPVMVAPGKPCVQRGVRRFRSATLRHSALGKTFAAPSNLEARKV
jgi:hypothetical protein